MGGEEEEEEEEAFQRRGRHFIQSERVVCMQRWMGGLQKVTVLGRFDTYKRGVRIKLMMYQICIQTMSVKGEV